MSAATTDRAATVGRRGEIIVSTVDGIGYCNLCGYNTHTNGAILALQKLFLSSTMELVLENSTTTSVLITRV